MWWNLIGLGIKTGAAIYKNKKQTQILESQARLLHYEKMARGEIEYKGRILDTQDKGIKDEIVLCVVLLPVLILGWSVFSDDPLIRDKIDLFFTYFKNLPYFYQFIFVSVICAIYGIKATDIIKRK